MARLTLSPAATSAGSSQSSTPLPGRAAHSKAKLSWSSDTVSPSAAIRAVTTSTDFSSWSAIVGAVIELAELADIAVPTTRHLHALTQARARALGIG